MVLTYLHVLDPEDLPLNQWNIRTLQMCQVIPYRCGVPFSRVLPAPLPLQVLLCPRWPWKFESKKSQCLERRYMAQYLEMAVRRPPGRGMWRRDVTRCSDVQSFMVLIEMLEDLAKLFASGNLHDFIWIYCICILCTLFFSMEKMRQRSCHCHSPLRWSVNRSSVGRSL